MVLPDLNPMLSFEQACEAVLGFLRHEIPLGHWSVTRFDGEDQVLLSVKGDAYGAQPGARQGWADTLCSLAVAGEAPMIAPDAMAIDAYRHAPAAQRMDIGSFVGLPILHPDGSPFGSLCGVDPKVQSPSLLGKEPLLRILSLLLASVLAADVARTDIAQRLVEAEIASETDPLTGLGNRRNWERHLALEDERCRRYGDPAGIVILDIDGLKAINDTSGHHAGDLLLCRTADTIRLTIRTNDIAARLGGDEFGVLLVHATNSTVTAFADRLRTNLAEAALGASVGAAANTTPDGLTTAWRAADKAMYEQKHRRKEQAAGDTAPTGS